MGTWMCFFQGAGNLPTRPIFSGQWQQLPWSKAGSGTQHFGPRAGGSQGIFPLLRMLEQEAVAASRGLTDLVKNTAKHFILSRFIFLNNWCDLTPE